MALAICFHPSQLGIHFGWHRSDFGCTTPLEYQAMACTFLQMAISIRPTIQECIRTNGEIVRYDDVSGEFAVVDPSGIVRTYFKPIPERLAPHGTPSWRKHTFNTNQEYFEDTCRR